MDAAHAVADAVATEIENVTEALSGGVNATVNGTNSTDANATGSFESHIMLVALIRVFLWVMRCVATILGLIST